MVYKVLSRPEKIFKTIRDRIVYLEYPPVNFSPKKNSAMNSKSAGHRSEKQFRS